MLKCTSMFLSALILSGSTLAESLSNRSCTKTSAEIETLEEIMGTGTQTMNGQGSKPMFESIKKIEQELVLKYGESQRVRVQLGLQQVASLWRKEDGNARAYEDFVRAHFVADQAILDTMFSRYERLLEQLDGHMIEIYRELRTQADLNLGPIFPFDEAFSGYNPAAHITEDFFKNRIAFSVLLNFPLTTLERRLTDGKHWSRREWAEARLSQRFSKRVPAEVELTVSKVAAEVEQYISEYNIWMHHLINEKGERLFPPKMKLLSHWNLRDEIKANYADSEKGLVKQRMIEKVMERIITQTIPSVVINNPEVDWNPLTNEVAPAAVTDSGMPKAKTIETSHAVEPDTRYAMLLKAFKASKLIDPHSPTTPSHIARRFDDEMEMAEDRVRKMFERILTSPVVPRMAKLIEARLGRPLEPFDLWYNGFRSGEQIDEAHLDNIVGQRYPTAEAFQKDIPNLLMKLGFSKERAQYLGDHIVVDPARGSGHAMGAGMRSAKAHLRTRIEEKGMNYKGFNVAVHELGHNVEQTFSLNDVDHTLLQGVPNTAFTEAVAFVFQSHDLELLGQSSQGPQSDALKTLNTFWSMYEMSGVALVDMAVWHWMYDHPNATPAELKAATLKISKRIWNEYYAPIFKKRDVVLLAIYSHMINSFLYLPNYPVGFLIQAQIEDQLRKKGKMGPEIERMTTLGRVAPDLWMEKATGAPVGPEALINAAEGALRELDRSNLK